MPCIIHLETSTKVCSVALSKAGSVLFKKENYNGSSHAEWLGVYVYEAFGYAKENNLKIDAVAVSSGPGSYTGLRIGLSEAKGFCYGLDVPLIAIPSLEILANQVILSGENADFFCPMIDARRMEVYTAIFDKDMNQIKSTGAEIIDENSFSDLLSEGKVCFFGDGASKCRTIIKSPNALFLDDVHPLASGMVFLAEKRYKQNKFENLAYFEPFYLKEFNATVPKNKVI